MKIVKRVSHPVPLHDVVLFARGEKQLPRNATAVTFDDGYWDTLLNALPILKTYDIPATVFVTTHPHAAEIGNDAPLLGQDGIRALSHEMLIDIGSHGATHRKLTRLGANDLRSELEDSKSYLETLTGKPCRFLAFPKGRSNDIVRDAVRQTGYEAALTTVHGLVRKGDDPFALKRIIVKRDTGHFEFRWRLTRIVDWMNKLWHVYTDYAG
jgi:peptidoglycan/xylan/chitin deacetylase (PgdA/CDA1 family)